MVTRKLRKLFFFNLLEEFTNELRTKSISEEISTFSLLETLLLLRASSSSVSTSLCQDLSIQMAKPLQLQV